jgi:hypothetical protein
MPILVAALVVVVPAAGLAANHYVPGTGPWVAIAAAMALVTQMWPARTHVDAWDKGASGEVEIGLALQGLGPEFVVLHDRKIPGSRANIDHLVVGPCGIFVVETKNVTGRVTVERGELRVSGRRRAYAEQAWKEAGAVQAVAATQCAALGLDVTPLLCFTTRAELPWRRASIEDVPILYPKGVVATIRERPARLAPSQVAELAQHLERELRAA